MVYLFLGPDDFSKKQNIHLLAKEQAAELEFFNDPALAPSLSHLAQGDLFSRPKISVLEDTVSAYSQMGDLDKLFASKNTVIFSQEKVDKRSSANKKFLADQRLEVKNFPLPHGDQLNHWLISRAKFYGANLPAEAAEELAARLGRDRAKETKFGGKVVEVEEVYNLWQADNELLKLQAFASAAAISKQDVVELVSENGEVDALAITNAIADNKKDQALGLLHGFLKEQTGSDEKGAVIQLNALLSEQFRNVAMVQDFTARKILENKILEKTGWKPGRLFVIKKIAGRFSPKKILQLLDKLAALDEELKTSQLPAKVLLDLIVVQLLT